MAEGYVQRVRVMFATGEAVKYVGHLDMHRAWERAIRRARLPLSYTQGFNPQPRLHFAAALPVGFTGRAEVVDVFLDEALEPDAFLARLSAALPPGVRPLRAQEAARELPSLQSQVCGALYCVAVEVGETAAAFRARLERFLACDRVWRQRRKGKAMASYDLRPLVQSLAYAGEVELGHAFEVGMRLEPGASGRPDELLAALGLEAAPRRIERLALFFVERGCMGVEPTVAAS